MTENCTYKCHLHMHFSQNRKNCTLSKCEAFVCYEHTFSVELEIDCALKNA